MIESELLRMLFLDIVLGVVTGVATWGLIESRAGRGLQDRLADWLGYFGLEPPEVTRYLVMVLLALLSLVVYGAALASSLIPDPGDVEGWLNFINFILQLFSIAYITSQICHARRKTRLALHQRAHPVDPVTTTDDSTVYCLDPSEFGSFLKVDPIWNVPIVREPDDSD